MRAGGKTKIGLIGARMLVGGFRFEVGRPCIVYGACERCLPSFL